MAENNHHHHNNHQHHHQQPLAKASSRLGLRTSGGGGGEIVEVHGGHIVRSTSRKDRHSKVCTAKGPRDRRVRLSAHTAIQFYDVQDRLGYDRPSKAVDWLIKKAKTAIDKLAELPPWKPTATTNPNSTSSANFEQNPDQLDRFEQHPDGRIVDNQLGNSQDSSFLSPSLDSDSIADTIKSFFPVGGSSNPTGNHQDLKLSLQSFQDPILQNHHHHQHHHRPQTQQDDNRNNNNVYFDGSGWPENPTGGFQRTVAWGGDAVTGGFVFSSPPAPAVAQAAFLQPLFGQTVTSGLFNNNSQREPLQSSTTTPSFRAWVDPLQPFTGVSIDQHPSLAFHRPFAGVPARIRGDEERDGVSGRPSSASSESRH